MEFQDYFPIWDKLEPGVQKQLAQSVVHRTAPKGSVIHAQSTDCTGLVLVEKGQLRACIRSEEGREITLYRLLERDVCLFSASCIMNSIQFDITIEAEKPTDLWLIPPELYKNLMEESAVLANFTSQLMANRFSEVIWLIEQILWKGFDRRLAGFLLEESALEEDSVLHITHENIANHLGTAREVVTRMLRYFQNEGWIALRRGSVELLDVDALMELQE